jgi:hypothetical protein
MYYSFRPESVHLWTLFCKYNGIPRCTKSNYGLCRPAERDVPNAQAQTDEIMGTP